ncbi:ADP-ribose pyrophosphatase YjhB, NUDIX family [Actinopolyspora lacussalsi subsp. righensis]|uniref:ADP-ribose pyrophosphatase YjhB, NUDIX family n=1 Tax=Actinopolyspora righensis TaxID=995060 RepID=A0A1I6Y694_9ACTN|nr:NUDIX domain-containing protein [Actinopolyspora righensis]SFT45932.1 ADP-ribose pyrophosphatase YjhB, NUDIX family [Actinopolyspora righensis]
MSDDPKHSVSVAGVVVDENERVLLIQRRDNGRWEAPGGVLELDETFEDGVKREILEETGVSVAVESLSGSYKNLSRGIIALVFRCRPLSGKPRATDESVDAGWFELSEALGRMSEVYAVRVSDAFAATPAIRNHDGVTVTQSLPT